MTEIGKAILLYLCLVCGISGKAEIVDTLTFDKTGAPEGAYTAWEGVRLTSTAVYAGESAGDNGYIQLRATQPSGIVTTGSGGKLRKISVKWQKYTADGRKLDCYGKNEAYEGSEELYVKAESVVGTKLGTIEKGRSTEIIVEGDYEYLGLRASSNSVYIDTIFVSWEQEDAPLTSLCAPLIGPASGSFTDAVVVTISAEDGADIFYTTDGTVPDGQSCAYTAPFTLTETTTVRAIAVRGEQRSEVAEATFRKIGGGAIDVLTREVTGVTGEAYAEWHGRTAGSAAVYAGNSAGNYGAIQLRSTANSGIVTTASGGRVKRIIVEWNEHTKEGRTLNVCVKNSAYASPADLYTNKTNDRKIGTIVKGTSTELEIVGNYTHFGLRSDDGAMYINAITIEWEAEETDGEAWGTHYLPYPVEIPHDVSAYIVVGARGNYVELERITGVVPAETGVIYNGKWEKPQQAELTSTTALKANLLTGTLTDSIVEEEAYVLSALPENVTLHKAQNFLNKACKAYLPKNVLPEASQEAEVLHLQLNETHITPPSATHSTTVIYDLAGRHVRSFTQPGLYIVNGKKVRVK